MFFMIALSNGFLWNNARISADYYFVEFIDSPRKAKTREIDKTARVLEIIFLFLLIISD